MHQATQPVQRTVEGSAISQRIRSALNWIYTQFSFGPVAKTAIVLAFFGVIPGAWIIGIPSIVIYGSIRANIIRRRDPARFRAAIAPYAARLRQLRYNLSQTTVESITNYILNNPAHVIKLFVATIAIFGMTMPFGFFISYGLFRFSTQEWADVFRNRTSDVFDTSAGFFRALDRNLSFNSKLGLFVGACVFFGILANWYGTGIALLDIGVILLESCATIVGLTAIKRDIGYFLRNPIRTLSNHPGKFYGIAWGRWLSFVLFPGRIVGSMGPASGHVDGAGLIPALFGWLIPATPSQGWFTFGSDLGGWLASRLFAFINSIVTSVFFSYNMRLQGDFYGVLGPTSFQIFACMALGCFLGYCFEGVANRFYNIAVYDAQEAFDNAKPKAHAFANFLYQNRWQIGFIAAITPLVMASAGGAIVIELAGNALFGTGLTVLTGVGALAFMYKMANLTRSLFNRIFHRRAGNIDPNINIVIERGAVIPKQSEPNVVIPTQPNASVVAHPEPEPSVVIHPEPEPESLIALQPASVLFVPAFEAGQVPEPVQEPDPTQEQKPVLAPGV